MGADMGKPEIACSSNDTRYLKDGGPPPLGPRKRVAQLRAARVCACARAQDEPDIRRHRQMRVSRGARGPAIALFLDLVS